ncbi:hypothetical protein [Actinomadura sp. HBU206391]|uniref:hypothetical protein n=1 Tax=Actinomadura sp. HBU206391 TaxID=2731692 RepID=UPI0016500EEA|nr:hypothetical protein [Actinomadura sp. HBU206391]MBC6456544.1 hypothetical protein [Actinomadura sp. HBU206391]
MVAHDDRIVFPGNPWPDGHAIVEFSWGGRLDPDVGLRFAFELTSAFYDADDGDGVEEEDEDEERSDFESKFAWNNYHQCRISSGMGFVAGTPDEPLDFDALTGRTFVVDRPEEVDEFEDEDFAFHIYLLGHDSVADHRIRFPVRHAPLEFGLEWEGRIALTYFGEEEYEYRFQARLARTAFTGFEVLDELADEEAHRLLAACVRDPARFRLSHDGGERRYVPIGR